MARRHRRPRPGALLAEYTAFVRDHPGVTLDAILEDEGPDRGWYPGGALLVMMVHEQGGTPALRRLLAGGRSNEALRATLVDLLGVSWDEVATAWRARAAREVKAPTRRSISRPPRALRSGRGSRDP